MEMKKDRCFFIGVKFYGLSKEYYFVDKEKSLKHLNAVVKICELGKMNHLGGILGRVKFL